MVVTHARASPKNLILWEWVTNVRPLDNACNAADIPYRSEGIDLFVKLQNLLEGLIRKSELIQNTKFEKSDHKRRSSSKKVEIKKPKLAT